MFTNFFSSKSQVKHGRKKTDKRSNKGRFVEPLYNWFFDYTSIAIQDYKKQQSYKQRYDPFQIDQLGHEFAYDPYADIKPDNQQVMMIDSCIDEQVTLCDIDLDDCPQPPKKKLRTTTMVENVVHSLVYGVFSITEYLRTEHKSYRIANEHRQHKQPVKEMRGFGVDFSPLVERPAALNFRIQQSERTIRDFCEKAQENVQQTIMNQRMLQCGGSPIFLKRKLDEASWVMVDNNSSNNKYPYHHRQQSAAVACY